MAGACDTKLTDTGRRLAYVWVTGAACDKDTKLIYEDDIFSRLLKVRFRTPELASFN